MKNALGFIAANTVASIMRWVFSEYGVEQYEMIAFRQHLEHSSAPCMRSKPGNARGDDETPITVMPIALHFGASASAMTPMPKMPTVFRKASLAGQRFQACSSWARTNPGRSRASASMVASAASDTGAPCTPCRLVTVTSGLSAG